MATDERSVVMLQSTDAEFRTWVSAMIAQLIAIGLTQTADTGQIDTATVAKPAAISTSQGYAIFRFNDTLQATVPIYMKIEFGSGAGAATVPQIWITYGAATDGAGTMTGTSYRARTAGTFGTAVATSYPWRACYNATIGMFWASWNNAAAASVVTSAMRTCDVDTGLPNGLGIGTWLTSGTMSLRLHDIALATAETVASLSAFPYSLSSAEPTFMDGGRFVAMASSSMLDSGHIVAFPGVLAVHSLHLPTFMVCYAAPYGTEYTYLALGIYGTYNVAVNAANNDRPVLIWE